MITVAELVAFLQTQPQDALCAYRCYSESNLLALDEITLFLACAPRADGWIQDKRPDMPPQEYLLFPGN